MSGEANSAQTKDKHLGISLLRIFATTAVIFLHTCSTIEQNPDLFIHTDVQHRFFELGHTLCLWTVPVFIMITGSLLLKPGKEYQFENIKKHCRRIILALLVFGIPFAGLIQYDSGVRGIELVKYSFLAIITNNSFAHLWYLYVLIGIYLCMPMIKKFVENASPKEIRQLMISIYGLSFVTSMIKRITDLNVAFFIPVGYSLFYILCAYYLSYVKRIEKKKWMLFAAIGIWIAEGIIVFTGILTKGLEYYDSPLIAIQAILLFSYFNGIKGEPKKCIWRIDRLCFGVYIIHPLFIHLAYRYFQFTPLQFESLYILATIAFAIGFILVSFIGSFILSMIPPIRKYIL